MSQRAVHAETALGPDLRFHSLRGTDALSRPFLYTLSLVAEDFEADPAALLGTGATVTVDCAHGPVFYHGLIDRFALVDYGQEAARYEAELRPWFAFLRYRRDCRIFQQMSVPDILQAVLSHHSNDFELRLSGSYPVYDYVVQYDESDFDFASRLMELEGVAYHFEHAEARHVMVLADNPGAHGPVEGCARVPYRAPHGRALLAEEFVDLWQPAAQVRPDAYAHTDYDFKKPGADLMAVSAAPAGHALDGSEVYAHPGGHTVGEGRELSRGEAMAAIRREEGQSDHRVVEAGGCIRGLVSGLLLSIEGFPRADQNVEHLVTAVEHEVHNPVYRAGTETEGPDFRLRFRAMPSSRPFRPARRTPSPVMRGPQTATVVGPAGEEIYPDEFARVKVQFHWDRLGAKDENSSCWVRVSQAWAGSGYGFVSLPRIGQEVIVDFIEGDPNRPIITGRVYNADQMPPYALAANKTQSGWKSRSSPGGTPGNFNELRFEDKTGAEEVYLQAEKDNTILVKNDRNELVQHDEGVRIDNNAKHSVGVNLDEDVGNNKTTAVGVNRTVSIGSNDTLTIGANHAVAVAIARVDAVGAAETRTVGAAQSVTVGAAQAISVGHTRQVSVGSSQSHDIGDDQSVSVGGSRSISVAKDQSHSVGENATMDIGKDLTVEAGDSIVLRCGKSSIVMKKDGTIQIEGKDITLKGSGKITVKASGNVIIKGSKILEN